jgi:hypothetical protein
MRRLPWLSIVVVGAVACISSNNPPGADARPSTNDVGHADAVTAPDASTATSDARVTSPDLDPAGSDLAQPVRDANQPAIDVRAQLDGVPGALDQSTADLARKNDAAPGLDGAPDNRLIDQAPGVDGPAGVDVPQPDAPVYAPPTSGRSLGGCQILPANHVFNTPIADLPVHPSSAAFISTIGNRNIHLDLGTSTDMTSAEYYGIPYNVVAGNSIAWTRVSYSSTDPDMGDPALDETDCVDQSSGTAHTIVSPCLASKAPNPWLPMPASPLVEGGVDRDPSQPYGDHHILIVDSSTCRLWELYHCYPSTAHNWDIFGSATFDLKSNALRPAGWTSADAAGFPILPLLLLASEASSGEIKHALRFTISSSSIRREYVWPARHLTSNGTTSSNLPPMGQLFRLKASYQIPSSYNTQSKAILQALKTYGMYIADGGSNMYIQGDPSADWQDSTFSQVQSVGSSQFEAVDISAITNRTGFDPNSAAMPSP